MWIRTQDKEDLLKIDNAFIDENCIVTYFKNGASYLGEYHSKHRAIEVLDVIESLLTTNTVYTMPEE